MVAAETAGRRGVSCGVEEGWEMGNGHAVGVLVGDYGDVAEVDGELHACFAHDDRV